MACQRCSSERIMSISGKCSDMCSVQINDKEHDGYVPRDLGIGGGDYIDLSICADCGQKQGTFPLPPSAMEAVSEDEGCGGDECECSCHEVNPKDDCVTCDADEED